MFKKAAEFFNSGVLDRSSQDFYLKILTNVLIHYEMNTPWKVCFPLVKVSVFLHGRPLSAQIWLKTTCICFPWMPPPLQLICYNNHLLLSLKEKMVSG